MVGNYSSMLGTGQQQTESAFSTTTWSRIGLSAELNLAIISGDLDNDSASSQLENLLERVKAHLIISNQLHLHIQLEKIDQNTISHMVDLVRILNTAALLDKFIVVNWVSSPDNSIINKIGEEFQVTSAFDWEIQK